jgi:hypothetical protein
MDVLHHHPPGGGGSVMPCLASISGCYLLTQPIGAFLYTLCFSTPAYCFLTYSPPFCLLVEVNALIMDLELTTTLAMGRHMGQLDRLLVI